MKKTLIVGLLSTLFTFSAFATADQPHVQRAEWIIKAKTFDAAIGEYASNCAIHAKMSGGVLIGLSELNVVQNNYGGLDVTGNCIFRKPSSVTRPADSGDNANPSALPAE